MFSFKYRHAESDPWETPASFAACLRVSIGFAIIGGTDFLFLLFLSPPDADRFAAAFGLITSPYAPFQGRGRAVGCKGIAGVARWR